MEICCVKREDYFVFNISMATVFENAFKGFKVFNK